jgi:phage tail protein X
MTYTIYTTVEGDRWDTVAFKAYGDPMKISPIIQANPQAPKSAVIPAGINLYVPIEELPTVNTSILPPWKR